MVDQAALVARVRGLSGRLLGGERLLEIARARSVTAFSDALAAAGYEPVPEAQRSDPARVERHLRRAAGARLAILADWAGDDRRLLTPIFEDEDRRSLRAILRGIVSGVAAEQRTRGLIATPTLPESALAELARQPSAAKVASLLTVWGSPYGAAMLSEATRPQPDLFRLQVAIDSTYSARALASAATTDPQMLRHVRFQIDVENAWTALAAAGGHVTGDPAALFVPGGSRVTRPVYLKAAAARTRDAATAELTAALKGSAVTRVIGAVDQRPQEDRMLVVALELLETETRADPLCLGVVLQYSLRLRAELHDLSRILWASVLQVPRDVITTQLLSA